MQRQWRELVAASHPEGLGVNAGVLPKLLVDGRHDRSLGSDFGQQFAKDASTESMDAPYLIAKFKAGNHLGRGRAARSEALAVRGIGPAPFKIRVVGRVALSGVVGNRAPPGPAWAWVMSNCHGRQ